jgi:ribonuclease VapC
VAKDSVDNIVLDTSAVIAFFCNEDGADLVESHLNKAKKGNVSLYISFATIAELFSSAVKKEGKEKAEYYMAIIRSLPVKVVHSDDDLCLSAGALKAKYKMSFADAFIASSALHLDGILVHKDPEFEALKQILRMETLPYKPYKHWK